MGHAGEYVQVEWYNNDRRWFHYQDAAYNRASPPVPPESRKPVRATPPDEQWRKKKKWVIVAAVLLHGVSRVVIALLYGIYLYWGGSGCHCELRLSGNYPSTPAPRSSS